MDMTPKKLLSSNKNCFICSVAVNSKQRMRVFKSGSKGTSSVDLQGLINKTLDIKATVYSNSDVAVCIKCYKSSVKYRKAEEHVQEIKTGRPARFQTSNFIGPYNLHRLLLSGLGLLFRSLPIVLLDQS